MNFWDKILTLLYGKLDIHANKNSELDLKFTERVFKANSIEIGRINAIYTITAADYSGDFFKRVKEGIENEEIVNSGEEPLTWENVHLHFNLVILEDERLFVLAIIYPSDPVQAHKVLWIHQIRKELKNDYVKSLMKYKVYTG